MKNKLRKYIIHKLGGIVWDDLSRELKSAYFSEIAKGNMPDVIVKYKKYENQN